MERRTGHLEDPGTHETSAHTPVRAKVLWTRSPSTRRRRPSSGVSAERRRLDGLREPMMSNQEPLSTLQGAVRRETRGFEEGTCELQTAQSKRSPFALRSDDYRALLTNNGNLLPLSSSPRTRGALTSWKCLTISTPGTGAKSKARIKSTRKTCISRIANRHLLGWASLARAPGRRCDDAYPRQLRGPATKLSSPPCVFILRT